MRKLIWLFLLLAVTANLTAESRRRAISLRTEASTTTLYRGDAGRTGFTTDLGPRWLETVNWERPLQGPVRGLVHDRGVIYAGGFGALYAVNPATGADFWVYSAPGVQFSPVAVVNDTVYVSGGTTFYAVNRTTGTLSWSLNTGATIDVTSPLVVDNVAYVGSTAGTVHAIDLATHAQLWSVNVGAPVRADIASAKNLLVVVTNAAIKVLRNQDGAERWSKAGNWAPAAATDKLVYAGAQNGAYTALDLNTGKVEWTFLFSEHPTGSWSAPALNGNILAMLNTNGWMYTVNADDGSRRLLMEQVTNLPVNQPITSASGRVYFGEGNDPNAPFAPYDLTVTDVNEGVQAVRFIYGQVIGGVALANGVVFTHDTTNTLSAFSD